MAGRHRDAELIEVHRQKVQDLLLPMIARYEFGELAATPEGRAVLAAPGELRASLAIAALAGPRSGWTAAHVAEVAWSDQWPAELVRALVRRTIDWNLESAALALRLVADTEFDHERIQLVLKAADQLAGSHPAHPEVMDGLDRLLARVQATPPHRYRVPEMRARVVASIARHTPPELLDLSPVADTDVWGPRARSVLSEAHERGVEVGPLLASLTAAPSSTTPSATWLAMVDQRLAVDGTRAVVKDLVRLLVDLDLDQTRPFVGPGNDSIARAAVWALGQGLVNAAEIGLLHEVILRCSQTNGQPHVTEALCGKAVGAAITALARLRDGNDSMAFEADRALRACWDTLDRGDVLRRIGRTLGFPDDHVADRVRAAQRAKAHRRAGRSDPRT